jgi:hypothetical protein
MKEIKINVEQKLRLENIDLKLQKVKTMANAQIRQLNGQVQELANDLFDKNKVKDRDNWNFDLGKSLLMKTKKGD